MKSKRGKGVMLSGCEATCSLAISIYGAYNCLTASSRLVALLPRCRLAQDSTARVHKVRFLPAGLPRSGKLPVLFLLRGQKSGFSPCRGDSLHRFRSNFAGLTGIWVRLTVQNFTSIGAEGWEWGPQNIKNFHFLVNGPPQGRLP